MKNKNLTTDGTDNTDKECVKAVMLLLISVKSV